MKKHDWADELARKIANDFGANPNRLRFDLVAARLRVVRQEGMGIGLDQAREVVSGASTQVIKFSELPAVSAEGFVADEENPGQEKPL